MDMLYVKTQAQKAIFDKELRGQLSDGNWENEETDERLWYVVVEVSTEAMGCNFDPKHPVNFNDDDLVDVVGDRMIGYAKEFDPSYDTEKLIADLEELTEMVFG